LVRVPEYKPGNEQATRAEYRAPDPACNPYLTFAVMLAAGLEGIEKGYEFPPPIEVDVYSLTEKEREELGIEVLPSSLGEAIKEMEKNTLVREC
jgi:glutamine synthetase